MPQQDFDVDGLARYLHLSPPQVLRLADRGKLPGRKVGGQWRFAQADIHHWLEDRIGLSDDLELAEVEGVLGQGAEATEPQVRIAEMLPPPTIAVPLAARTRASVITEMVHVAARTGWLWDPQKMIDAVRARESLHPTALDNGVALLHPRRPMSSIVAEPCLALGRTNQPLPFGGSAGSLTDIFFLICSVDDRGHLRTLARLSRLISDAGLLDAIRAAVDAEAVYEAIRDAEQRLFP